VRFGGHRRHVLAEPRAVGHLAELLLALSLCGHRIVRETANGRRLSMGSGHGGNRGQHER
jgi:hypothetical protein